MLFFAGDTSDYASNLEVQKLGVTFVPIVDHEKGLTERRFEEGIKIWRERRRERALLTLTVPAVDDGAGRRGSNGRRSTVAAASAEQEKRGEESRMARRPVPPHSHHSDGSVSRHHQQPQSQSQSQQQTQYQTRQQQQQQAQQVQQRTPHRTQPRPLQLQHRWNSESRQWEIINTQQHYTLRSPNTPCSPTSATGAMTKERPWTADPLRLSPWSNSGEDRWVRAESEPPVSLHHHHHHHQSQHHHHSSPAQLQVRGFEGARGMALTPPLSVSSPEMDDEEDDDDD
ncbi:hypothetical protein FRC00_010090, partial [Tulasnella sp. 408]